MAVEIEFTNVIIRKSALDARYPGGLDGFATTELPNYIEDDDLVRVGFMGTRQAYDLATDLAQHGMAFDDTTQSDVAVVQHDSNSGWLTIGPINDSIGCWLTSSDSGSLIKCTNGFLLRCPRDLFDRLEPVLESCEIAVVRSVPPPEDRKDFIQVVHFLRGNASIVARVVGGTSRNSPVGLWASRDFSRRQHCADDIRISDEIEAILMTNGAKNG